MVKSAIKIAIKLILEGNESLNIADKIEMFAKFFTSVYVSHDDDPNLL